MSQVKYGCFQDILKTKWLKDIYNKILFGKWDFDHIYKTETQKIYKCFQDIFKEMTQLKFRSFRQL